MLKGLSIDRTLLNGISLKRKKKTHVETALLMKSTGILGRTRSPPIEAEFRPECNVAM